MDSPSSALTVLDRPKARREVQISLALAGGWDVTATLDGHVVFSRHCADWHRAERARAYLESELARVESYAKSAA